MIFSNLIMSTIIGGISDCDYQKINFSLNRCYIGYTTFIQPFKYRLSVKYLTDTITKQFFLYSLVLQLNKICTLHEKLASDDVFKFKAKG